MRKSIDKTRAQLHELIDKVDDSTLLELYLKLLEKYSGQATFDPTDDEIEMVLEGLKSVERNGTLSHEEAMSKLRSKFPDIIL